MVQTQETSSDYYETLFDQNQIGSPLDVDSSFTVAQKQKFTVRDLSPEWGYATEATKVCDIQLCLVMLYTKIYNYLLKVLISFK